MAHKQLELQERDIALLETVRDLTVISLNQIQRLFWPEAGREVARKRLSHLMNRGQGWLTNFTVPKPEMQAAGLEPGKIYCLSKNGHSWFRNQDCPPGNHPNPRQYLHDLLVTEIRVRLAEYARLGQGWTTSWHPDWRIAFHLRGADHPLFIPDGLGVLSHQNDTRFSFFLELDFSREAHGRPSARFARKMRGYDTFLKKPWPDQPGMAGLPWFPPVLVITHGARRLENLANSIIRFRRGPVAYALARREELLTPTSKLLKTPVWHLIPAKDDEITPPCALTDPEAQPWYESLHRNSPTKARPPTKPKPQPVKAKPPATQTPPPPEKTKLPPQSPPPPVKAEPPPRTHVPQRSVLTPNLEILTPYTIRPQLSGTSLIKHRLKYRLLRPNTGHPVADYLLNDAYDLNLAWGWYPIPDILLEYLAERAIPPPAGVLMLNDTLFLLDIYPEDTDNSNRHNRLWESLYIWHGDKLEPYWPQVALVILPDEPEVKPAAARLSTLNGPISFLLADRFRLMATSYPLMSLRWVRIFTNQNVSPRTPGWQALVGID